MAVVTLNPDNTITITLSPIEQSIISPELVESFGNYTNLWIDNRVKIDFAEKFALLSDQDQTMILEKFSAKAQQMKVDNG